MHPSRIRIGPGNEDLEQVLPSRIRDELIEHRLQLRALGPHRPAKLRRFAQNQVPPDVDVGEVPGPDVREPFLAHGDPDQADVDHVEHVFALELVGQELDPDGRQRTARRVRVLEARVELDQMIVEALVPADVDRLTREVVQRADGGRARPGDENLVHVAEGGRREIESLHACGRNRERSAGHVSLAVDQAL